MSNESQYINPIIDTMFRTFQGQQAKEELKARTDQFKAENALREQQLAQHESEFQRQHDLEERVFNEVHIPQLQAAMAANRLHQINTMYEMMRSGASPQIGAAAVGGTYHPSVNLIPGSEQNGPGTTLPGSVNIPGVNGGPGTDIPENVLPTAQSEADRIKTLAGAQTTGQLSAQQPFLDAAALRTQQNEREKLLLEHQNRLEELKVQGGNAQALQERREAGENSRANINGMYHLRGIQLMHSLGLDTDQNSEIIKNLNDGIWNGQIDYKSLTPDQKKAVTAYNAANGETPPTDGKEYKKQLDNVGNLEGLLNQAQDLAINYSYDGPKGGLIANARKGQLGGLVGKSDLNSKLDSFKSSGGALASTFDQQNRKSDAEIIRQTLGAFDPKATVAQNLQKIEDQRAKLNQVIKNNLVGASPDRINSVLSTRGITQFGDVAPKDPLGIR